MTLAVLSCRVDVGLKGGSGWMWMEREEGDAGGDGGGSCPQSQPRALNMTFQLATEH